MKLSIGHLRSDARKRSNCDVESLMPVERAWVCEQEFAVLRSGSSLSHKYTEVWAIPHDAALLCSGRSNYEPISPDIIGNDNMIGKLRRASLDEEHEFEDETGMADFELTRIKFGEQIMYIENYGNFLPLRKHCREDKKVRNVVYMYGVV